MNPKQTFLRAISLSTAITTLLGATPKDASANRGESAGTEQAVNEPLVTHSRRKFVLTPALRENANGNGHLAGHSSHSSHASGSTGGGHYNPRSTDTSPPAKTPPPADTPPTAVSPSNPIAPVPQTRASKVPGIPTGLASTPSDGGVVLRWTRVEGALTYNVKRATRPQGPYLVVMNCRGTTYYDNKLQNRLTYYYVVSALNFSGESDASVHISAMPNGPLPTKLPSPAPPASPNPILPASETQSAPVPLLSEANLVGLSDSALVIMRNTPYARHGYAFPGMKPKMLSLRQYFKTKSWYKPDTDDEMLVFSRMSPNERANIELIVKTEKRRHPNKL